MTGSLRLILGDQLTGDISSLAGLDPASDVVLMVEVAEEATYVRHHKQKLVFVLSAMRHFAEGLCAQGIAVDYVRLEDPENSHSFTGEVERAIRRHGPRDIIVTEPGEWRVLMMIERWSEAFGLPVHIREDGRFLCSRAAFARLTAARKTTRMEFFYREMRRRTGYLMAEGAPEGGAWNFDADNRKALPRGAPLPKRLRFAPDAVTREVMALVERRFGDHFGKLDSFGWAVTREDARAALDHFIADCLPRFGDYQDAMKAGEDFLFHAALSPYLNVGLLTAREVCDRAVDAWSSGAAPLNAVEGFLRQIIGWREFVRGVYWTEMPAYPASNHLDARRPLPAFFWDGQTPMRCLADCIRTTFDNAYAHHIQRLMVIGNFALLAGLAPPEVEEWYLLVYADAFEWVELPNVHGMVLHADGGRLGSKPYAASGAYIDRMSDYCGGCAYDPGLKSGPRACPFNYLYWHFLMVNAERLGRNPRMAMPYRTLDRMSEARRADIRQDAESFLAALDRPPSPAVQQSLDFG